MNQLNSIIIEGNVAEKPQLKNVNGIDLSITKIAVHRNGEEESCFDVYTYGKLAKATVERWSVGRAIKVVGRLKQEISVNEDGSECSRFCIISEHIEWAPKS